MDESTEIGIGLVLKTSQGVSNFSCRFESDMDRQMEDARKVRKVFAKHWLVKQ
jgi:hypothetical protein